MFFANRKIVDMLLEPKVQTGRIVDMFLTTILRTGKENDYLFRFLVPSCAGKQINDISSFSFFHQGKYLAQFNSRTDWYINWSKFSNDTEIYGLFIKGDVVCANDAYLLRDNETEEVLETLPIRQNEEGQDTEDRIVLLKDYITRKFS